jgi:CheY-like chemotaxis protein
MVIQSQKYRILLVEDNPGDVVLIRHALESHDIDYEFITISDGECAVQYARDFRDTGGAAPSLIVLDLNLPSRHGLEVLTAIRATEGLASTPVAIFTTSDSPVEQRQAEAIGVEAYLRKPLDVEDFFALGSIFKQLCVCGRP